MEGREGFDSTDIDMNFSPEPGLSVFYHSSGEVWLTTTAFVCKLHQITAVFDILSDI